MTQTIENRISEVKQELAERFDAGLEEPLLLAQAYKSSVHELNGLLHETRGNNSEYAAVIKELEPWIKGFANYARGLVDTFEREYTQADRDDYGLRSDLSNGIDVVVNEFAPILGAYITLRRNRYGLLDENTEKQSTELYILGWNPQEGSDDIIYDAIEPEHVLELIN